MNEGCHAKEDHTRGYSGCANAVKTPYHVECWFRLNFGGVLFLVVVLLWLCHVVFLVPTALFFPDWKPRRSRTTGVSPCPSGGDHSLPGLQWVRCLLRHLGRVFAVCCLPRPHGWQAGGSHEQFSVTGDVVRPRSPDASIVVATLTATCASELEVSILHPRQTLHKDCGATTNCGRLPGCGSARAAARRSFIHVRSAETASGCGRESQSTSPGTTRTR